MASILPRYHARALEIVVTGIVDVGDVAQLRAFLEVANEYYA